MLVLYLLPLRPAVNYKGRHCKGRPFVGYCPGAAGHGVGVACTFSLAASSAVFGIPAITQRVSASMMAGWSVPFVGIWRISTFDGSFGSVIGCPAMTCSR